MGRSDWMLIRSPDPQEGLCMSLVLEPMGRRNWLIEFLALDMGLREPGERVGELGSEDIANGGGASTLRVNSWLRF
ncbi:hypothetical protein M8818_005968 [Zalaria obscura]|uniref:Uncharacterized protein n=1 Tax=Zalaria obscura TaxID=2024903 RepID=A0ACC3S704_9PEZI